jgi:hypothetical protein
LLQLDKAAADAAEYKAGFDKYAADAAELKAGYDKLTADNWEQKAQVGVLHCGSRVEAMSCLFHQVYCMYSCAAKPPLGAQDAKQCKSSSLQRLCTQRLVYICMSGLDHFAAFVTLQCSCVAIGAIQQMLG